MSFHRKPPPFPYQGPVRLGGWCCFCGDEILPATVKPGEKLGRHERWRPAQSTWHLECVEIYRIATSSGDARRAVFRRDRGVCAECGVVAIGPKVVKPRFFGGWTRLETELFGRHRLSSRDLAHPKRREIDALEREARRTGDFTLGEFYIPIEIEPEAWLFEVDHIVPLYRAPREWRYWGLENLRTLCRPCHRVVTAEQARERAGLEPDGRQLTLDIEAAA